MASDELNNDKSMAYNCRSRFFRSICQFRDDKLKG